MQFPAGFISATWLLFGNPGPPCLSVPVPVPVVSVAVSVVHGEFTLHDSTDVPFAGAPSSPQETPFIGETQLLTELQRLSALNAQWLIELRETATQFRRRVSLPEYRTWHLEWKQRIQNGYIQLSRCYEMISRVYRTNPKSPLYPRLREVYLQAKRGFDQLQALHAETAIRDEQLPVAYHRRDGKLIAHLSPIMEQATTSTASGAVSGAQVSSSPGILPDSPAATGVSPPDIFTRLLQRSENITLEYIGTFDLIEVYLLRQPEESFYVMHGWRQPTLRNQEELLEVSPHFIIAGPLAQAKPADSAWHFDQIIQLSPFTVQLGNELWEKVMDAMSRSRTYTRRQP